MSLKMNTRPDTTTDGTGYNKCDKNIVAQMDQGVISEQ